MYVLDIDCSIFCGRMATSRHQSQQQQQQQQEQTQQNEEDPRGLLRRSHGGSWKSLIHKVLVFVTFLLRLLLWPVRRLVHIMFPVIAGDNEFACEWFVSSGYTATLNQVHEESKVLLVYLTSPFHPSNHNHIPFLHDLLEPIMTTTNILTCWGGTLHSTDGTSVAQQLHASQFPYLAMVHVKSSSSNSNNFTLELLMSVSGNALIYPSNKVLIQNVMRNICVRQETLVAEAEMRRMQLEEETRLRAEQDAEYQASLLLDRQREEQRRLEQQKQQEEQQQKEQHISHLRSLLSSNEEEQYPKIMIRFVLPTGMKLERPFSTIDTIEKLIAYLTIENMDRNLLPNTTRFGLCTNYPRKTLHTLPLTSTLQQAGLSPPSTVIMVQDLDA